MSILGVVLRVRPEAAAAMAARLVELPGVEVGEAPSPADGRLVIVIEDAGGHSAAETLGTLARWPDVLATSLAYEYSGPDSPADEALEGYGDWRRSLSPPTGSGS